MRVHVAITAYSDGLRQRGYPMPAYVRTHGVYSEAKDAVKKIENLAIEDLRAFDGATSTTGNDRTMKRTDSRLNPNEIHIANEHGEFITYRVVQQDVVVGMGD